MHLKAKIKCKSKGKGHPTTGYEGPEVKERYSSTLSLISALHGGGQRHGPAILPPGKTQSGWATVSNWTCAEDLAHTGIRSPNRPARSETLYRLS